MTPPPVVSLEAAVAKTFAAVARLSEVADDLDDLGLKDDTVAICEWLVDIQEKLAGRRLAQNPPKSVRLGRYVLPF